MSRPGLLIHTLVFDVSDHADDFEPRMGRVGIATEFDPLADGILIRPMSFGEPLINHGDARRIVSVAFREKPSP